jgi:hypothetical protein
VTAEEYTRRLAAAGSTKEAQDLAAEADALSLSDGVEDALLAAEDIARRSGEPLLADCLARLEAIWNIGGVQYALDLLNRARDAALEALREVTDEEGLTEAGKEVQDIGQ